MNISKFPCCIGNSGDLCSVVLHDYAVSPIHAQLCNKNGRVILEDLGSTSGTFLNGIKLSAPTEVLNGADVTLGNTHIIFTISQ